VQPLGRGVARARVVREFLHAETTSGVLSAEPLSTTITSAFLPGHRRIALDRSQALFQCVGAVFRTHDDRHVNHVSIPVCAGVRNCRLGRYALAQHHSLQNCHLPSTRGLRTHLHVSHVRQHLDRLVGQHMGIKEVDEGIWLVSIIMILDISTWSRRPCNPSTTRSARGCHPCLRYNLLLPVCPGRTNNRLAEGVSFFGKRISMAYAKRGAASPIRSPFLAADSYLRRSARIIKKALRRFATSS
jgi:hypothetical protein